MSTMKYIMSFREAYRLFEKELVVAKHQSYVSYLRYLRCLGFSDFIYHIVAACALYPRSMDASRDSLADMAHSMYQLHGDFRLRHEDQERLSRLAILAGEEVIRTLDSQNFYNDRVSTVSATNCFDAFYDALTATVSTFRIGQSTFEVKIKEEMEEDMHSDLSNKHFESTTQQWSH